jgi:hypothetical protein
MANNAVRNADNAPAAYRGLGKLVTATTLAGALQETGLDWRVARRPMEIVGSKGGRKESRFMALVRSSDGEELAVASKQYSVIQNADLLRPFWNAAAEAGATRLRAGCTDGGQRIFMDAELPASFELPTTKYWADFIRRSPNHGWAQGTGKDKTVLRLLCTTGHVPGYKAKFHVVAERLICLNGAKIAEDLVDANVSHRGDTTRRLKNIQDLFVNSVARFEDYREKAQKLAGAQSSKAVDLAFVVNLVQAEAFQAVVNETEEQINGGRSRHLAGAELLAAVLDRTRQDRLEAALAGTRTGRDILDAIESQPGGEAMTGRNLWNTYNGVTYYVDHVAGRSANAAINSALLGPGAELKNRALDLAIEYTAAAQIRAGVALN